MSAQLTIPQVITIGDATLYLMSNYNDEGQLFGARLLKNSSPELVGMVTDALRWEYDAYHTTPTAGTGAITIDDLGNVGDNIQVDVQLLTGEIIPLGSYTEQSTDTDTTILASSVAGALGAEGFTITSTDNVINITCPIELGGLVNDGLIVTITNYSRIFNYTFNNTFA